MYECLWQHFSPLLHDATNGHFSEVGTSVNIFYNTCLLFICELKKTLKEVRLLRAL